MKDLLLAIDNGTQSLRALVFDLQGNVQAKAQIEIEPYFLLSQAGLSNTLRCIGRRSVMPASNSGSRALIRSELPVWRLPVNAARW